MRQFAILLSALLFTCGIAGCSDTNVVEPLAISTPGAEYNCEVEIINTFCTDSGSSRFPFRFTLKNLTGEDIEVSYRWTLNDPKADFPGSQQNINDPGARQYQGQGNASLPTSGTKDIVINIKETREYDPRFYVMYISVYRDGNQIGYYRGQKSTYDWDYSVTPPAPRSGK